MCTFVEWTILLCLPVGNCALLLHELKQRSSDITGRHYRLVDSDVTEGSKRLEVMSEIQQGHYKHDRSNETIFEQLSSF